MALAKVGKYKTHTDNLKRKAVKLYLANGNFTTTAKILKINYDTLLEWKNTSWWKELSQKYREELDVKLASKIDTVVEKAVDGVLDRVENGEKILDSKSGSVISVPVKTRDLNQTIKVLSDRQDILIGRQKQQEVTTKTINEKLQLLAESFEKFAGKQKVPEIVEAEFEEIDSALSEERCP